jgi:GalNAc-alpha-(1->4)-GalNAc-alpha-(1->3)-diNAcBac-PP-undecaprenol alpha-1,4-N-acetyl-D-galactosaminyltransferase
MKLLFVIDNLGTGGAQRQQVTLATGLKQRGCAVEFFCYSSGDLLAQPLQKAGIPVHQYVKRSRYSPDVLVALRDLMARGAFDAVLSFLATPNLYAIVAGHMLRKGPRAMVVSERFCDAVGVTITERMVRQLYRLASFVVVNSHHQRLSLLRQYPFLHERIATIYNGYDLRLFAPAGDTPEHDELQLLTIASISPYKNGLCLVEALRELRQQHGLSPSVTWIGQQVMAGDRLAYRQEMDRRIEEYGLAAQWHWLGQRADVVAQLHAHDALVHPSYGEGLPNVVCEALACARPVIVSNTLDHPFLVRDNDNGFLFDYQDPADLAARICSFAQLTPAQRQAMGRSGRCFAEAHLSLERYVADYQSLFARLTGRWPQ